MNRISEMKCIPEVYTGQSCIQQLAASQMCTLGSKEPVMVSVVGQQQQIEQNVITFLSALCKLIAIHVL